MKVCRVRVGIMYNISAKVDDASIGVIQMRVLVKKMTT